MIVRALSPDAAQRRLDRARDDAVADIAREFDGGLSLVQIIAVGKALDAYAAEAVHVRALSRRYEEP